MQHLNKLPTAAIYWPSLAARPEIVIVDDYDALTDCWVTRNHGKLERFTVFTVDKEATIYLLARLARRLKQKKMRLKLFNPEEA